MKRADAFATSIALALVACAPACTKKLLDDKPPPPTATKPPPPPPDRSAYDRAVAGHESWRPSADPCPIKMSPLPPPKPGENLGQLALNVGAREGRLNTNVVKSFDEGKPLGTTGDAVEVLYVESTRVDPALDPSSQTYTAGTSKGTAYVWDRAASRFACMAEVNARSSASVTSLGKEDRSAALWLALDLMFAIEREVADKARAIASADTAIDAGSKDGGRNK